MFNPHPFDDPLAINRPELSEDVNNKKQKSKAGVLLIASPRFKNPGTGLPKGTYGERKAGDVEGIICSLNSFNDIDPAMFKLIGLRAGFYHPLFNENISVLVPEADIGAGLITYMLKLISGKHVNFIEPFHIEAAYGAFASGHAGPNDHNDPDFIQNVLIARDVRFAKTGYKYAGAPFAWYRISPGRKTMAQLVECNGKYKLICTLVDSLEGKHLLATYSHSIFKPLVPVTELFEQILKTGTTQHFALVDGEYLTELSILAEIMDFEYYEIS
jgi:L-arabinose isomerase